jgi:macrolide-specific efflux system membrane fusion protein
VWAAPEAPALGQWAVLSRVRQSKQLLPVRPVPEDEPWAEPAPRHPSPTGRGRRWLVAASVALALAVAAWLGWERWGAAEPPADYATAVVRRGTVEDVVSALGNIQPRDYVDVGTQVSGQLRRIHVAVGDRVASGDLLAELDPTVYQARVDAGRAQRDNLRAQLEERQARLTLAEQALRRQENLRRANATSQELLEQAQAELRVTTAQIAALRAQIGQTESDLRANEANLGYTRIYAPMTGTVVSITARQGQTLNANQSAPIILRLADLSVMTVQTQVSEADVSRLRIGQETYFSTLGDPDRRYVGALRQIMPTPEVVNNVVLYPALFDVPNEEGRLMTQMTAQVFFVVARAENVLTVPASALRLEAGGGPDGTAVLVPGPDGTLERRPVETGIATRTAVEIRSGLAEGEVVVTGPLPSPSDNGGTSGRRPVPRARLG